MSTAVQVDRTATEREIRRLLETEQDPVLLSEQLFAPDGLFNQLAPTRDERRNLVRSPLFREALARLRAVHVAAHQRGAAEQGDRGKPMAAEPEAMTVREAGKKGGTIVRQRYGKEFYEEIGKKGSRTTRAKYGPDFYGQIGKKGGQTTSERHGPEFYEKIGKKGGQRVKELIERAKAQE